LISIPLVDDPCMFHHLYVELLCRGFACARCRNRKPFLALQHSDLHYFSAVFLAFGIRSGLRSVSIIIQCFTYANMSDNNGLALICHTDALPTMSPTISEILDRQQATLSQDRQTLEQRLQALELAIKDLQECVVLCSQQTVLDS
jgi:hypothetical protein